VRNGRSYLIAPGRGRPFHRYSVERIFVVFGNDSDRTDTGVPKRTRDIRPRGIHACTRRTAVIRRAVSRARYIARGDLFTTREPTPSPRPS